MPAIRYILRFCFLSCLLALIGASSAGAVAPTITRCQPIKLQAVGGAASGLLGCEGKGIKSGTAVSSACQAKITGKLSKGIADGDAAGVCPGLDVSLQGSTTTFAGEVAATLHPAGGPSLCTLKKLTAVRKRVGKSLKLYAFMKRKPNKPCRRTGLRGGYRGYGWWTGSAMRSSRRGMCHPPGSRPDSSHPFARDPGVSARRRRT
jgi:hypothetical protein